MSEGKRSVAALAASNHWAKKQRVEEEISPVKQDQEIPLKATLDVQEVLLDPVNLPIEIIEIPDHTSPIRLLKNPSIPRDGDFMNKDTIRLTELLHVEDLRETFQFNFNVDLGFFLPLLHPEFVKNKRPITFITGSSILDHEDMVFIKEEYNIREIVARLPFKYGTHHTKMMINFYDNSVEVVIMTCNLTKLDIGAMTQMLWSSGKLGRISNNQIQPQFKIDLINYIHKYKSGALSKLTERLKAFDFLLVEVELVASSPGEYNLAEITDDTETYGYGKLHQVLKRNNLLVGEDSKHYNIVSQVSSISGSLSTTQGRSSSVFTHLICPLVFSRSSPFKVLQPGKYSAMQHQKSFHYIPSIVFPTVKEIAGSTVGFGLGQAIHFKYTGYNNLQYEQNIKPYLKKWNSSEYSGETGRERIPPHVKLLLCDNGDDWKSLRFVLMGSHNLSKQAWGAPIQTSNIYRVASYELSVLVVPRDGSLVPTYGSDTNEKSESIPVRLPFKLPPKNYAEDDMPWSMHVSHGDIVDVFGEKYNIE